VWNHHSRRTAKQAAIRPPFDTHPTTSFVQCGARVCKVLQFDCTRWKVSCRCWRLRRVIQDAFLLKRHHQCTIQNCVSPCFFVKYTFSHLMNIVRVGSRAKEIQLLEGCVETEFATTQQHSDERPPSRYNKKMPGKYSTQRIVTTWSIALALNP
jgi:hypothetical protein